MQDGGIRLKFVPTHGLRNQLLHDIAVDVGEAKVSALKSIGQPGVVETKYMKDRGVQIVDVDWIFNDSPAYIVSRTNHLPAFDSPTCHPHAECVRVMIASGDATAAGSVFAEWRAAEFRSPDDKRLNQQASNNAAIG